MQIVIDRVMQTYGMIVHMTPEQQQTYRENVAAHLASCANEDVQALTIEGLRFLRSSRN